MEPQQQDSSMNAPAYAGTSTPEPPTNALSPNRVAPEKPRVWSVFLAFVMLFIVGLIASGVYLGIAILVTGSGDISGDPRERMERALENPNIMIPSIAVMGITALAIAGICSWLSPERVWDRLSLRSSRLGARGYLAAIVTVYGTSMAVGQLIQPFTDTNSPTLKLLDARLRAADSFMFGLAVAIIAGLAPIAEEVFFRGYMQTRLQRRWGPGWGIGISAVAFGVFHADPVQTPFAIAIGVALGYVAERNGSIRPAIVCHGINNMVAVMSTKLPESQHNQSTSWPALAVGIIAAIAGVSWFQRMEKTAALNAR